jgi:hypothetical protein
VNAHGADWIALRAGWREALRHALTEVLHADVDARSVADVLAGLSGKRLLAVDAAIRRIDHRGVTAVAHDEVPEARELDACVFAVAARRSGFHREHAIAVLRRHPGRLAMASALIRCVDWVPGVRAAAMAQVGDWMRDAETSGLVFASLDLLPLLQGRERLAQSFFADAIEPVLRAPRYAMHRRDAARSGHAALRRAALELMVRDDPRTACELALADRDPSIAGRGLELLAAHEASEESSAAMQAALRHPSATIRATAVRRLGEAHGAIDSAPHIEMLFDPAAAPRNAAAYLLRTRCGIDALQLWRRAVDQVSDPGTADRRQRAAIVALSSVAQSEDVARLEPWLSHPSGAQRTAALRGLAKAQAPELPKHLGVALLDDSSRVVATAIALAATSGMPFDAAALEAAFARAACGNIRRAVLRGTVHLDKWQGLLALMRWLSAAKNHEVAPVSQALRLWIRLEPGRFAAASVEVRADLQAALAALRRAHPASSWSELAFAVEHA